MKRIIPVLTVLVAVCISILYIKPARIRELSDIIDEEVTKNSKSSSLCHEENITEEKGMRNPESRSKSAGKAFAKVDTDPQSLTVLVNRHYRMPKGYIPPNLVVPDVPFCYSGIYEKSYMRHIAAEALENLFAGAEERGYMLRAVSAYRSYERQKAIYDENVSSRGEAETDKVSAKPGSSEHQTGLSVDVSCKCVNYTIEESFGDTPEGKWLAKNCHKYGFIIRYPEDKTEITGYSYEPWHVRYVGKKLARYLYKNNLTLEEYYQVPEREKKNSSGEKIHDQDTVKGKWRLYQN